MRFCGLLGIVVLVVGCAGKEDGGEGGSFGGSYGTTLDTGDDMMDTGESGMETGDGGTTGDTGTDTGTTDTGTTSTGDTTDTGGGFVPPSDDTGGGGGAYAPCPGGTCENGESCLSGEGPNEGKSYCAEICSPAGNPANCPDPPDGDAMPICIDVNDGMGGGNTSYCALDCSGGETCPTGLGCVDETDANGPIKICL